MKCFHSIFFVCISLLSLSSEITIPKLSSRVNDYAEIISDANEMYLNQLLQNHEDSTSNQVVILTVNSLNEYSIDYYSIKVVEDWELGTKENDNGVLILVAPNERKMRIEVGDGLQGYLTDALSKRIIENKFLPAFKKGNYEKGIVKGTQAVISAIDGTYINTEENLEYNNELGLGGKLLIGGIFGTFVTGFLLLFAIPAIVSKSVTGKLFTLIWYGMFCLVLTMAIHWFFLILWFLYFVFVILTFLLPVREWLLEKGWVQKLSGAEKNKSGVWQVPISKSSGSSWSGSNSSSSYSGGGGSFSGGGSRGSW